MKSDPRYQPRDKIGDRYLVHQTANLPLDAKHLGRGKRNNGLQGLAGHLD